MDRAPSRSSARPRISRRWAKRRALLRVADVLRANLRPRAHGHAVRGPAVGRLGTDRLHRARPRVGARPPHPDRYVGASRVARRTPELGGGTAQLHLDAPRAAQRRGHAQAALGSGSGIARPSHRPDRRTGRRHFSIRRGDGTHVRRPRLPRTRRRCLASRRGPRPSRCSRDPAFLDRCTPRRAEWSGQAFAPGCLGPRKDLHHGGIECVHRR